MKQRKSVKRIVRRQPLDIRAGIDEIQDALDRLQVLHEEGYAIGAALVVLAKTMADLEDAVEDARDAEIAAKCLAEIEANPALVVSGQDLADELLKLMK